MFAKAGEPPAGNLPPWNDAWQDYTYLRTLTRYRDWFVAYLSFPLLEGILKKMAGAYVDYSGETKQKWDAPASGAYNPYGPRAQPYELGANKHRCSSIRDLLFLVYEQIADADLKHGLDAIRTHLNQFDTSIDAFQLLYDWRNSSLHGEHLQGIGGTVLSIVMLLALAQIRDTFELRKSALQGILQFRRNTGWHMPFTFYRL